MPRTPFREVWHLMVTPDFSRVDHGEMKRPWVDQRAVDFMRLRQLLIEGLSLGDVNVRVPNDTIDQVTIHFREQESGIGSDLFRCKDLADRFRRECTKQEGMVIDVSRVWKNRQHLTDRDNVPPPVIVPMLVESVDFEDMVMLRTNVRLLLGMLKEHPLERVGRLFANPTQELEPAEELQEGRLPSLLLKGFEELFGIAYHPEAAIDFVSHDREPSWARNL